MKIDDLFKNYKNANIISKSYIDKGIEESVIISTNDNKYVIKRHKTDIYDSPRGFLAGAKLMRIIDNKTDIPVPDVKYLDYNNGQPYYIMEFIDGEHYSLDDGDDNLLRLLIKQLGQNLAELHNIDCERTHYGWQSYRDDELETFDEYEYFDELMFDKINEFTEDIDDGGKYPKLDIPFRFSDCLDDIEKISQYFQNNIRIKGEYAYCHWDYKYDNIIIKNDYNPVKAIIDWENPVLGDPLFNIVKSERNLIYKHRMYDNISESKKVDLIDLLRESYNKNVNNQIDFNDAYVQEKIWFYKYYILLECMSNFGLWFNGFEIEEKITAERYYRNQLETIKEATLS